MIRKIADGNVNSYVTTNVYYVTFRYPYTRCSRVFQSCLFHSCDLVPRFPVPRFQRPRIMQMMPKSSPHTRVGTLLPVTGDACLIFQRDANIHNTWSKRHSSIMLCDCYQIFKQARLIVYNTATGVTTGKTVWTCTAGLSVLSFTVNNRKKCTTMVYFHCDMTLTPCFCTVLWLLTYSTKPIVIHYRAFLF